MLPPQSLRAEPIFSLALNLTRIVVVMFFTTFSPWGYVERLWGRGPVQSSLAASSSVDRSLRHAHLLYAILTWCTPGLSNNTQQGSPSSSPFRYRKTLFVTPKRHEWHFRQTFRTLETDLVHIAQCSEAQFRLRSKRSQFLRNQNMQWREGQLTG